MHFVWAFSDGDVRRRNFCRARLIIFAALLALGMLVVLGLLLFTGLLAGLSHKYH